MFINNIDLTKKETKTTHILKHCLTIIDEFVLHIRGKLVAQNKSKCTQFIKHIPVCYM